MFRNMLVTTALITSTLLACTTMHAVAQTTAKEEMFENNKITLTDNGERDTIRVTDPVTGDTMLKIPPILYPIKINETATTAEKKPYPISALMQKTLTTELSNPKYLKSIFDGKPIPDGVLIIGLTNIVLTPDGTVAYYNLYKTDYYIEKKKVVRKIDLEKDILNILKETSIQLKQKFKEPYLVLNGKMTTITFRVNNGVIKP
jgi:hypothetical protein